jgi:geranylgeranyl diphosphate synthase type II
MDSAINARVKQKLEAYRLKFESYLTDTRTDRSNGVPARLFEAMEYSLNAGGKRLRPALCLAAAERCGCLLESALSMALGLEMFHTGTLIHDDLPCMDNDDMRRGKPSCHVRFGEALALLAGDSLMLEAAEFPLTHTKDVSPERLQQAMQIFTSAMGPFGVCGGQVLDMGEDEGAGDPDYVRKIARLKTGALIRAAVMTGAALGTGDGHLLDCYYNYGTHLGSAFQIVDDILDVTSTAAELGKTPGKDAEQNKLTHVTVYGMDKAKAMAAEESRLAAIAVAKVLPQDDFLAELPAYLTGRTC